MNRAVVGSIPTCGSLMSRIRALGLLVLSSANASAQGGISGTVFDSLITHAPLANATVVLVERSKYVATDAHGRFRIDSVPDGRYTLSFIHPVLDSLGLPGPPTVLQAATTLHVT